LDERETATIVIDHAGPPPDIFQTFIETNPVAATLAMHYTLQVSTVSIKTDGADLGPLGYFCTVGTFRMARSPIV
jgi:hypothetical protein